MNKVIYSKIPGFITGYEVTHRHTHTHSPTDTWSEKKFFIGLDKQVVICGTEFCLVYVQCIIRYQKHFFQYRPTSSAGP